MAIKTVGVLGCGLMGAGIAQVSAAAGFRTIVREVTTACSTRGSAASTSSSTTAWRRARSTAEARDTTLAQPHRARRRSTTSKDCDLVIEAIVENLEEKTRGLRGARGASSARTTIFASNTSSLCITELAAATKRPDRFGGLHFFNPVPLMKLVEVDPRADDERRDLPDALFAFAQALGKEPITAPDRPGFIVNRLLVPYLLDAIRCLRERPRHGRGHRQGHEARLRLPDGAVHAARLRRPRHDLLHRQHHVRGVPRAGLRAAAAAQADGAGRAGLGRRAGEGFYNY